MRLPAHIEALVVKDVDDRTEEEEKLLDEYDAAVAKVKAKAGNKSAVIHSLVQAQLYTMEQANLQESDQYKDLHARNEAFKDFIGRDATLGIEEPPVTEEGPAE